MTRSEIKQRMLNQIQANLTERLDELESTITPEEVDEYIWSKDFGDEIVDEYIDNNDIRNELLESIYKEIDSDDLDNPF